jgi:hypothetical protein
MGIGTSRTPIGISVGGKGAFAFAPAETPTGLALTVISDTQINLAWTDNSTNEEGYVIERSTDGITYAAIDTVLANVVAYSDGTLVAGTTYYYRVRPFLGGVYGEYSNVVNTTTYGVDYAVLDTLADGKYNIMAGLAQNPTNYDKVIMTYCAGAAPGYDATKVLNMRVSNDRGQTFGAASTIYDPGGVLCVQEQHSGYTSDGRFHILCTLIDDATPAVPSLIYLYSDNDGVDFTVTDITALVTDATYVIWRQSGGLVENNGALLSAFYSRNATPNSWRRLCLRLVNGTWTKVTVETTATNETESSIEVLGGDNLIMMTRSDVSPYFFIQYLSADNGLTWTRLGQITFGLTATGGWPAQLKSFTMNGERIIAFYFPHNTSPYALKVIYGRAIDLLELGLAGWHYSTLKDIIANPNTTFGKLYLYHGEVLHYNNNYNSIACWPSINAGTTISDIRTFEMDTTDSATLEQYLTPTYSADADSNAFNAVVNTNPAAIVNLIGGLKEYSIYTKIKAAYPMLGGTAALHKYNLVNPADSDAAFRLHFAGTWVHSATGAKPNGIDAIADTHLNPSTQLTLYTTALGYYSRTNVSEAGVDMGALYTSGTTNPCCMLRVRYTDGKGRHYAYNGWTAADAAITAVVSDSRKFTIGVRTANNVNKIYINGLQSGATVTATALSSTAAFTIYIGASNTSGTATGFTTKECAFAIIIDGVISDADVRNLNRIIHYFQKALSRNV